MTLHITELESRLLPFVALQGLMSTLGGFAGVFVFAAGGMPATVRYAAVMLTAAMLGVVVPYALGRLWHLRCERLVRAAFMLPALLLWFAEGRPDVLALAFGGFLGLSWAARHWLELNLLPDSQRDAYAAHATVLTVLASLAALLTVTLLLQFNADREQPVHRLYALIALAGAALASARLPATPTIRLVAPWAVVAQREFVACLPLFGLESGMFGIGLVVSASGAVHALGRVSHYGWVATAATVAGAMALYAVRRRRQAHNRVRWMALAGAGMALAHALLGASALLPALYVLHLVLQSGVGPFWSASEQVLNQRTLDIRGAVSDRIAARESVLWLFRIVILGSFWFAAGGLPDGVLLMLGAGLMALSVLLEFALGRAWLRRGPVLHDSVVL